MSYNTISIKPYIKSHLELQREITLIELAPSPYFFVSSICLAYINMFARFDENPVMTLQDTKETKHYRRTDNVKTVYPPQTKFEGGIKTISKKRGSLQTWKHTSLSPVGLFGASKFKGDRTVELQRPSANDKSCH